MAKPLPAVGQWFQPAGGEPLEVVAVDPDDGTIEVQYFDGTVEEFELQEWRAMAMEAMEAPEDWTGSLDVEPEDTENEYEAEPGTTRPWVDALQYVDRGEITGYSEFELPEASDEAERY
jgi:hypothetical protein